MKGQSASVVRAAEGSADAMSHILTTGFLGDPIFEWAFGDSPDRRKFYYDFIRPFVELTFDEGEIYTTRDLTAAALWIPVDAATHADQPKLWDIFLPIMGPIYAERIGIFDECSTANHPTQDPHMYLPFIAVLPEAQGRGIGTALLRDRLAEFDRQGISAYLEATTLRSTKLYSRLGFTRQDETTNIPDGPSLYPMWRNSSTGEGMQGSAGLSH